MRRSISRCMRWMYGNVYFNFLIKKLQHLKYKVVGRNSIKNRGVCRLNKEIIGYNNSVIIGNGSTIRKGRLIINGNNNILEIGNNCKIGKNCVFFLIGNDLRITIGNATTFTRDVEINAQEHGVFIEIGEDCMFSNNIIVRTSDSHPIYEKSGERVNLPKSVIIGKHVWIAPNTKVMKGAVVEEGAIVGSDTTVTGVVPAYSLCVGRPQRIIKENVRWTREFLNK